MVTAVQWLKTYVEYKRHANLLTYSSIDEALEEALRMEKDQIEDAYMAGKWDWNNHIEKNEESEDSSVYYNKNYGNDNGE